MFGSWEVNVSIGGMPQSVATACAKMNEMVGAEYEPIAYLGSQQVNGTNHAVLATQNIISGRDVKNIVLLIFHETKEGVTLQNIERIVEGGAELGGTKIDPVTEIPEDANAAFESVLSGFVGAAVKPFALLATQVVKGTNYVFAARVTPVTANPEVKVAIVTVNPLLKTSSFTDILKSGLETSLGKPLSQWP